MSPPPRLARLAIEAGRAIVRRLRFLGRGGREDDTDMQEEMRLHIALLSEQNRARGLNAAQARRQALLTFGSPDALAETCREQRPGAWLTDLLRDLGHGLRVLRRDPGFGAAVILTLALGIGAATAIFSVTSSLLLRPLPYPEPDHLVMLHATKDARLVHTPVGVRKYLLWQRQAAAFENLAAIQVTDGVPGRPGAYNLSGAGETVRVSAGRVTANFFAALRSYPFLGRTFAADEDVPGRGNVAILSHGFWMRQLGGRPEALGQTIRLDGQPFNVIGVMPAGFQLDRPFDIFTPAALTTDDPDHRGDGEVLEVVGRLKAGQTIAAAQAEMTALAERWAKSHPMAKGWGVKVMPMLESKVSGVQPVLLALLGAVGLLLLIACANVANLLLARASVREREIAVRVALGAGRGRLIRQLLAESLLLAALGGLLGVAIARWGIAALSAFAPEGLPRAREIVVDARAFAFTCALALGTGIGFGLAPALKATRVDLSGALRQGGRGAGAAGRGLRLRGALVVAELALSMILLVGAGLLMRGVARAQGVDPGFRAEGLLAITLTRPETRYGSDPCWADFAERAVARLAAIPGVQAVAAADVLPFSLDTGGFYNNAPVKIAGRPVSGADQPIMNAFMITAGYFQTMRIPIIRGRAFDARDSAAGVPVAIINESVARQLFPGQDPIGQRIDGIDYAPTWREIVGVVGDVQLDRGAVGLGGLDVGGATSSPSLVFKLQGYVPLAQLPWATQTFVVRSAGDLRRLAGEREIRRAIHEVDRDQAITSIRPVTEMVARSMARERFALLVFAVFSGVALLLAAVGVYGVMSYAVAQRTGEIGIRMALGARRGQVLGLVLAQGARMIAGGVAAGLTGAWLLTRFLGSVLYGVGARDPLTFIAIAALLALAAALACLLAAHRATRVDPMTALRAE